MMLGTNPWLLPPPTTRLRSLAVPLHQHFRGTRPFPCLFLSCQLWSSRNTIRRSPTWSAQNKTAPHVCHLRWDHNDEGAGVAEGQGRRRESAGHLEVQCAVCARITDDASTGGSRVPILIKCLDFILNQSRAAVLYVPVWCRSTAIVVGLFLFFGVRAAAGVQNPVNPKPTPIISRLPSCSAITGASAASANIGNLNGGDLLLQREGPNEQVDVKENTACSDAKAAAVAAKETKTTGSSQNATSRIDPLDERGRDAEPVDEYDYEFDEQYEDEDEELDEFDESFADVNADERIYKSEPRRKAKGEDTDTTSEEAVIEMMGSKSKSKLEKEMEKAFEEWRASPYKLTVPLRVVGLRGSVPAIWLKDFILSQGKRAKTRIEYQGSLRDIVSALATSLQKNQIKPRSIIAADAVTVGDCWLRLAVSGGLIEPIKDAEYHDWFKRLGPKWQVNLLAFGDDWLLLIRLENG